MQFQLVQARSNCCRLLGSCGQGALVSPFMLVRTRSMLVSPFMLVQTRSVGVAFYARADNERYVMQFRLVQARSFESYSLGLCGQGALVRAV
ncbi:hypothetical protein COP2_003023 [Malus domestica]